jgi:hypothetical protein
MVKRVGIAARRGDTPDDMLTINYHNLLFMLINAIKELATDVDALKGRL